MFNFRARWLKRARTMLLAVALLVLNSAASNAAAVKKHVLRPVAEISDASLSAKRGFLLIYLDVDGIAPTLEIRPIEEKSKNKRRTASIQPIRLSLTSNKKGLYGVPFARGEYQITTVMAPHYNLPYIFTTNQSKRWRFRIEAQSTNYVGHILLEKERTTRSIFVKLLNRIATDRKLIEQQAAHLTAVAPLRSGSWLRDDYLDFAGSEHASSN